MAETFDLRRLIRDSIKRVHLLAIPACFAADTLVGFRIYRKLLKKYGMTTRRIYFVDYRGTGDTYIGCAILDDAGLVGEDAVFVAPSALSERTAKLFPFSAVDRIRYKQSYAIREMMRFYGAGICIYPILYESNVQLYSGILRYMSGYSGLDFWYMMRVGLEANAGLSPDVPVGGIDRPRIKPAPQEAIDRIFEDNELIKGKTVLLAPYIGGQDLNNVSSAVFFYIASVLKKKGYTICTNSADPVKEPVIGGTTGLKLDFRELIPFLERAGTLISCRSGLCDIAAQADCRIIILNEEFPKFEGVSAWYEFFSLKRFGVRGDITEIVWPQERERLIALMEEM